MTKAKNFDFIVVGTGISGTTLALELSIHGSVALISKNSLTDTTTSWAQGGIAFSQNTKIEKEPHIKDTITVGRGLCDEKRVTKMVSHSEKAIQYLSNLGVKFDKKDQNYDLALEAGHQKPRVLHCKDHTGLSIQQILKKCVHQNKNISLFEHSRVIKLCILDNQCNGVWLLSKNKSLSLLLANHVSLATGGYSQLFSNASTPNDMIGDGIFLAYEAGALIEDMEMIQFHPTVYLNNNTKNTFLISEAVRGAGGLIIDKNGKQFLQNYEAGHELAPRDILARSIFSHIKKHGKVFLNLSQINDFKTKFPSIYHNLIQENISTNFEFIPIVPAAHYTIGGIVVNENGFTSVEGLSAVGECACSRVHGANRLASNSLLDGLVFAKVLSKEIIKQSISYKNIKSSQFTEPTFSYSTNDIIQNKIKTWMWQYAGLFRQKDSLNILKHNLEDLISNFDKMSHDEKIMTTNAYLIVKSCLYRKESRGCHYRTDYKSSKNQFLGHIQHHKNTGLQWQAK